MKGIRLEEHSPDGTRRPIGVVLSSDTLIGRDPGRGLKVDRGSISRTHGVFFLLEQKWCYKDLGSTNGSWHNGRVLKKDQVCIIRPGDKLQLADTFIVASSSDQVGARSWDEDTASFDSVLVFDNGIGFGEYRVPQDGLVVSLGGVGSSVELPDYLGSEPRMKIESRGRALQLSVAELPRNEIADYSVLLNGKQVFGAVQLSDRDEVVCGSFSLLINKPPAQSGVGAAPETDLKPHIIHQEVRPTDPVAARRATTEIPKDAPFRDDIRVDSTGHVRQRSQSSLTTFGQITDLGDDEPPSPKMERMLGSRSAQGAASAGFPPTTRRFSSELLNKDNSQPGLKDRLLALIGFLMVVSLMAAGLWLLFASPKNVKKEVSPPTEQENTAIEPE